MIDSYRSFFTASTGASAAFIGLLFVALSLIEGEKVSQQLIAWRRIVASSSFSQLVNVFFVSLAGILPSSRIFAGIGCIMAILGLAASFLLLPKTMNEQRTGRRSPTMLGILAVGVYVLELITSAGLLHSPNNQTLLNFFIVAIILLYAGALARAWSITGTKTR